MLALPALAHAGDVSGSLELPESIVYGEPLGGCKERQCFWNERNGVVPVERHRRDIGKELSVVLTGRRTENSPNAYMLHLVGGGIEPALLVIHNGGSLEIINEDPYPRAPVAEGIKELSGHTIAPEAKKTIKILETGKKEIRDRTLPHAHAYVHAVTNLVATASLSSSGSFRFSGLEPGRYSLKVFFQEGVIAEQNVTVPYRGVVKLDPIQIGAPKAGK